MKQLWTFHCEQDILNPETQEPILFEGQTYDVTEVVDLAREYGFDYLIGYLEGSIAGRIE